MHAMSLWERSQARTLPYECDFVAEGYRGLNITTCECYMYRQQELHGRFRAISTR